MTDFKALGYQTGEIILPGLDLIIQLNPNQYFRNDGIVSDLNASTKKVFQQFGRSYQEEISPDAYGICVRLTIEEKKLSTIFIRDIDPLTNLLVLGHEATHALIYLGFCHSLVDALQAERFSLNPFEKYDIEEDIAHIGGLLALHKANKINYVITRDFLLEAEIHVESPPPRLKSLLGDLLNSHFLRNSYK